MLAQALIQLAIVSIFFVIIYRLLIRGWQRRLAEKEEHLSDKDKTIKRKEEELEEVAKLLKAKEGELETLGRLSGNAKRVKKLKKKEGEMREEINEVLTEKEEEDER